MGLKVEEWNKVCVFVCMCRHAKLLLSLVDMHVGDPSVE